MAFDRTFDMRGRTTNAFTVSPESLDTGTVTNQAVRDHVNNRNGDPRDYGTAPAQYSYNFSGGGTTGFGEFNNSPGASGNYQAGHIRARQNGGIGDEPGFVFPQNPSQNMGGDWRRLEQGTHNAVHNSGMPAQVAVTRRDAPRPTYGTPAQSQALSNNYFGWLGSGGDHDDEGGDMDWTPH
jgi:hypothetical protein